jgi:hypothetical protein|tara:strand:- start:1192 stop:1851 length:660 start_codon:yes stop_codon:yes gene_type:complete
MIKLPDFTIPFEYENNFYLSCDSQRMAKSIAHFKFLETSAPIPGEIIECGVFKGASLSRLAMFRKILNLEEKSLIGFDTFGKFPETNYDQDKELREEFINTSGDESIDKDQLLQVLRSKDCALNTELVKGDITQTVPEYVAQNPSLKISLLNIDVDVFEPTQTILDYFYNCVTKGGILILDDYNSFPGETNAIDQFFKDKQESIQDPLFSDTPYFVVKE